MYAVLSNTRASASSSSSDYDCLDPRTRKNDTTYAKLKTVVNDLAEEEEEEEEELIVRKERGGSLPDVFASTEAEYDQPQAFARRASLPSRPLPAFNAVQPKYFHGALTRKEAENVLFAEGPKNGLFLVREKKPNTEYAITCISGKAMQHHLIRRSIRKNCTMGRHFVINDIRLQNCFTVEDVIEQLQKPNNVLGKEPMCFLPMPRQ